ncbi:MAG: hypothetical protein IPL60_08345 [Ardenticatenia bacterium]|nr:hypothetical protein [Ardenticatenia bacterium]
MSREVVRVVTPGTLVEGDLLEARANNWLAAVTWETGDRLGLALIDATTGDFLCTELSGSTAGQRLLDELARLRPAELLHAESAVAEHRRLTALREDLRAIDLSTVLMPYSSWRFDPDNARRQILEHFGTVSLSAWLRAVAAGHRRRRSGSWPTSESQQLGRPPDPRAGHLPGRCVPASGCGHPSQPRNLGDLARRQAAGNPLGRVGRDAHCHGRPTAAGLAGPAPCWIWRPSRRATTRWRPWPPTSACGSLAAAAGRPAGCRASVEPPPRRLRRAARASCRAWPGAWKDWQIWRPCWTAGRSRLIRWHRW